MDQSFLPAKQHTAIEPSYTSGWGQYETKFPVYGNNSVTMYRPLVHLRAERERQLKCFEVTCPLMDRNTKHAHLYTYLTVEKSFRICYKAQSANDHPPSLKETLYGRNRLQTKQYFI